MTIHDKRDKLASSKTTMHENEASTEALLLLRMRSAHRTLDFLHS